MDDVKPYEGFARIQWKGTDVCIDISCPCCGSTAHLDCEFLYVYECSGCHRFFRMGDAVAMTLIDPTDEEREFAKGDG